MVTFVSEKVSDKRTSADTVSTTGKILREPLLDVVFGLPSVTLMMIRPRKRRSEPQQGKCLKNMDSRLSGTAIARLD
jgi:hypothetical protein